MKTYITLFSFIISISIQAGSGCLVRSKTKVSIDPSCKCLETKSCAKQDKLQYSKKFFDVKKDNGKTLFSEQEKVAYQKSYKLLNEINELKSQGKRDSKEIKKAYFELDKVNNEITILLHKNHADFLSKQKKRYAEKSKERKENSLKRDKEIKAFLEKKATPSLAVQRPVLNPVQEANGKVEVKEIALQPKKEVLAQEAQVKMDGLSDDDKKEILRNINEKQLKVTEEDSLFDIISKTYKGRAYKKLWAPKDLEESASGLKTP